MKAAATERSVVEEVLCADVERTKLTTEEADLLEKIEASTEADTEELILILIVTVTVETDKSCYHYTHADNTTIICIT